MVRLPVLASWDASSARRGPVGVTDARVRSPVSTLYPWSFAEFLPGGTVEPAMLELSNNDSKLHLLDAEADEHSAAEFSDEDELPESRSVQRRSLDPELSAESLFSAEVA